jgi:hypothetical protein
VFIACAPVSKPIAVSSGRGEVGLHQPVLDRCLYAERTTCSNSFCSARSIDATRPFGAVDPVVEQTGPDVALAHRGIVWSAVIGHDAADSAPVPPHTPTTDGSGRLLGLDRLLKRRASGSSDRREPQKRLNALKIAPRRALSSHVRAAGAKVTRPGSPRTCPRPRVGAVTIPARSRRPPFRVLRKQPRQIGETTHGT